MVTSEAVPEFSVLWNGVSAWFPDIEVMGIRAGWTEDAKRVIAESRLRDGALAWNTYEAEGNLPGLTKRPL